MLQATRDNEQIIERIAALDIGKEEVVCCVRVPDPASGRRLQDVTTHRTMTRALLARHATTGRQRRRASTPPGRPIPPCALVLAL